MFKTGDYNESSKINTVTSIVNVLRGILIHLFVFFYLLTYHIVKNTKREESDAIWCKRNSDFSKGYYKDLMIINTFAIKKIDNHNDEVK